MQVRLLQGDCLLRMRVIDDESVDSLVTDPPAGISFMGKAWDDDKGGRDQWQAWMTDVMKEALRVMKPGAHGLVWAIPRTSHWTATALENAGFEIRDVVTHLFGTGFPKSLDVSKAIDKAAGAEREVLGENPYNELRGKSGDTGCLKAPQEASYITAPATDAAKQWQGWGTALKPASEHWILVRKPCSEKTVAANVLKWGTGALNIDASRIGTEERTFKGMSTAAASGAKTFRDDNWQPKDVTTTVVGRFPANLVFSADADKTLDEQAGDSVSRFFYVAKASKADKNEGLEDREAVTVNDGRQTPIDNAFQRGETARLNTHPTVKSTALMEYLITLITPPGGLVFDPFMGSGSTGKAAVKLGHAFVGIEKETEYFAIAKSRIEAA